MTESDIDKMVQAVTVPGGSILDTVRARRSVVASTVKELRDRAATSTASQSRSLRSAVDTGTEYLCRLDERITELEESEQREAASARHRVESGMAGREERTGYDYQTRAGGEQVYAPTRTESFFRDLANSRRGDWAAGSGCTETTSSPKRPGRSATPTAPAAPVASSRPRTGWSTSTSSSPGRRGRPRT